MKTAIFGQFDNFRSGVFDRNGQKALLRTKTFHLRRAPHELFPKKGVPHQIPAGLENFAKSFLARRFVHFGEHIF